MSCKADAMKMCPLGLRLSLRGNVAVVESIATRWPSCSMNDARLDDQIDLLCATHVTFPHNGDSALRNLGLLEFGVSTRRRGLGLERSTQGQRSKERRILHLTLRGAHSDRRARSQGTERPGFGPPSHPPT
jgi:hypothetical protein